MFVAGIFVGYIASNKFFDGIFYGLIMGLIAGLVMALLVFLLTLMAGSNAGFGAGLFVGPLTFDVKIYLIIIYGIIATIGGFVGSLLKNFS